MLTDDMMQMLKWIEDNGNALVLWYHTGYIAGNDLLVSKSMFSNKDIESDGENDYDASDKNA